jgi:hypothetical protein
MVPAARNPSPAQQRTRKRGPPMSWQGDRERRRSGFPPAAQGRRRRSGPLLRQRRAVPERGLASPEFAANSRPPKRAPSCAKAATPLAIKPLAISRELCLSPCEPAPHEGKMKFQVGRFTCELSLDDKGEVQAEWLPWQPKYLNKDERVRYRVARAAFLERADPGSIVDVVDRLASTDLRVGGAFHGTPKGVRVSATPRGSHRQ